MSEGETPGMRDAWASVSGSIFVSSELIDGHGTFDHVYDMGGEKVSFYEYLKAKYPGFKCKHRLLYHWGYNSRPWSNAIEEKVMGYGWDEETIKSIQQDFIVEQKRRNGYTNELTENLFGYGHSGKEAKIARILVSIIYDTHILGDYEPDNSDLDGLMDIGSVIGDIVNQIQALDKVNGKPLIGKLRKIQNDPSIDDVQIKAELFMKELKHGFSVVLQNAEDGSIKKHLENVGFAFTSMAIPCDTSLLKESEDSVNRSDTVLIHDEYSSSMGANQTMAGSSFFQWMMKVGLIVLILSALFAIFRYILA